MEKKPVVVLTGPTAVGKTALSLSLARRIRGEIVSADSIQVYRGLDIGSAKIRPEERQGVPHHLIDVLDPREEFHVVRFQEMAKQAMEEIWARSHIPILTGGTGFYIQAVLYDIDFTQNGEDKACRRRLEQIAKEQGAAKLHEKLAAVDPLSAQNIHPNNIKRVVRALEYYEQTGEPISSHNERERNKTSPYSFAYFVLNDRRERLYARIEHRVDEMMEAGLVDEVRRLRAQGCTRSLTSMQGLGYREMLEYLDKEVSLDEAVRRLKRDTRHFAKRQITWFQRERDVIWLEKETFLYDEDRMMQYMLQILRRRGVIGDESDNAGIV